MKQSIKPFADQGHYTEAHNLIFDYIMPRVSANAFKVLCLILRRTKGWGKAADAISYNQIKDGTGIKSDTTISRAIGELLDMNCILNKANPTQRVTSKYALNRGYSIPVNELYEGATTPKNGVVSDSFTTPENGVDGPENSTATPENGVVATPFSGVAVESGTTPKNGDTKENKQSTNQANSSKKSASTRTPENLQQNSSPNFQHQPFIEGADDERFESPHFLAVCHACARGPTSIPHKLKCQLSVAAIQLEEQGFSPEDIERGGQEHPFSTPPTPEQLSGNLKAWLSVKPPGAGKDNSHGSHHSSPPRRPARVENDEAAAEQFIARRQQRAARTGS